MTDSYVAPDGPTQKTPSIQPKHHLLFTVSFLLLFLCLAVLNITKILALDSISIALITIGFVPLVLPYISKNFKSFEIFGVKAELFEKKLESQDQKIDSQEAKLKEQEKIIFNLVRYSMSASIFHHLCGICLLKNYKYENTDSFRREMYFLRDNGYIKPRNDGFIDFGATTDGRNLVDVAEPTPIGKDCVRLRMGDIPEDMLKDLQNLRIKPSEL